MSKFPSRFKPSLPYSGTPTDVPVRGAGRMADPSSPEEWQDALGQYQDEHTSIETVDPDKDPDVWDSIQENGIDMMLGVPRGVIQAGMGLYDLADWATLDLLPDWEKNPLGRSKTALGGLVEGMTNFATGFIPIVGWLGKAGQAHKAVRGFGLLYKTKGAFGKLASKAGRMPHGGPVVRTVFGDRYISKAAERALRVKGLNDKHFRRMANLSRGGRYLTAGILTDFTVFDAHEQRMSDMMNTAFGGALANPVSEYLASDPDDGELEGRLKNVMEGLLFEAGIGSAVGLTKAVIGGIRAIKNGRRVRAAGGSPQEVDAAMTDTRDGPVEDAAEIGEQAQQVLEDSHTRPPDPEMEAPESRVFSEYIGAGVGEHSLARAVNVGASELDDRVVIETNRVLEGRIAGNQAYGPTNANTRSPQEIADANPDVYIATPECTQFSVANNFKKISPNDVDAAEHISQVIEVARPPTFILENVKEYQGSPLYDKIMDALEKAGYEVDARLIDSADYGGVQSRPRLIIRAVRKDLNVKIPDLPQKTGPGDWWEAVKDLMDEAEDTTVGPKEMASIQEGVERFKRGDPKERGNKFDPTKPIITMGASRGKTANARGAGGAAPTLTATQKAKPTILLPDGKGGWKVKRVSPRMMARIMGLSDDFPLPDPSKFGTPLAHARFAKQILGNGVQGETVRSVFQPMVDLGRSVRRRGQAPDVQGGRVEAPRPETDAPTPDTSINAGSTRTIVQEGMDLDEQWKGLGKKGKGLAERRRMLLSPYIEKLMTYANKVLDQLELFEGIDVKTIRINEFNKLRDMPNSKAKADKIRAFLNKTVLPLQEGNLELRTVAPGKPIDAPTRERRAIREDELVRIGREANSNQEYQTTLLNRLHQLSKEPGKRVDIPDRSSSAWKKMSQAQRARELRKRVLDAEFGHMAHGIETITMTKGLRKGIQNLSTAAANAKNLFDEYGKLRVNEVRELFESMHENERAFFKGILGLPEGRSQVRRQPVGPEGVAGTGEFSIGLEGRNQRDILATALEWAKDPMFRPPERKGNKNLTAQERTQQYYDLVDEIFGHNIDPADVGQVQKALGMGEELSEAAGKAERLTHAFKILQQGYYLEVSKISEAYRKAVAAGNRDEANKLGMSMVASFFNLNNMAEQWMRAGSLTGAALEARKTIDITQYLKSHDLIDKGLDDQIEHLNLLVSSGEVPEEIITQYKRSMSLRGKLLNAGVEAWTNALISGPKTIFGVTTVGNVFGMFYFPLERLVGHSVVGAGYSVLGKSELAKANFKEVEIVSKMMTNMVLQANYTLRGTSRVMRTGQSRVIPGSSRMDSPATGHRGDTQQITAENFWSPEAGVRNQLGRWVKGESGEWQFESSDKGAIIDWIGGFLNLPSRTMKSMDEIYKTAVVRSYVESELAAQGLKFIVHGKQGGNRWGQGRETSTMSTKKQAYEKRKAQDIEIENIWESGTNAKFADQAVLAEEITAQVNGKVYKLIDENGSVYTKARGHEDALQRVIGEGEFTAGSLGFKHKVKEIIDEEWNPQVGAIGMEAQRLGLKSTWQDPLERGGLSSTISKFAKSHPLARLLFPFIKTPTNLLRFVTQRAPRAKFVSEYRQLQKQANQFKADGAEQLYREAQKKSAELMGRLSMGVTMFTGASYLAFSGVITGNGPRNKNARRNLEASGWQPYSFRIGGDYYSYARLEPLSTFLGLVADLVEISNHTYEHDYGDTVLETIASSIAGSLSNNITNKTYLTGLTNFLNAAQDGERFGWKLAQSYLTSAMPYSSFMYQTRGTYQKVVNEEDMKFRDARDIFDAYAKKTGWNLEDVPLRYDLTGKPVNRPNGHWPSLGLDLTFDWVNPFTVSRGSKDPVTQAFVDLKLNDGPPKAMIRGHIDMRDEYNEGSKESAYSAYQRTTGEIKIGGRTLHQALDRLVRHKVWKDIPKDPIEGVDSPARNLIRSIVQKYRKTAFKTVLRDYPTLRAKYLNAKRAKAQFLR